MYICHQPHSFIFLPGVNHDLESSEFFKLVTIQYDFYNFLTSFYIVLENDPVIHITTTYQLTEISEAFLNSPIFP